MKFIELLETLSGKENITLYVDRLKLHFTAQNAELKYQDREIGEIRLQPQIYLGLEIYLRG